MLFLTIFSSVEASVEPLLTSLLYDGELSLLFPYYRFVLQVFYSVDIQDQEALAVEHLFYSLILHIDFSTKQEVIKLRSLDLCL